MSRSRRLIAVAAAVAAAALALAGCSSGSGSDSSPGAAGATDSGYLTAGTLTIGTAEPAYAPWVQDDKPESGKGFEAAVAYAVADKLGFAKEHVSWVRTTFDQAIAPGPKTFDINLQQFSITDERKKAVDFSSPYYETTQAIVTTDASPAAKATSLADLKSLAIGAQTGTTSFAAAEKQIAPSGGVQAFNSNDDAKLALENKQVDAIVVDLPTAFYLRDAELTGGRIVGQLPKVDGQQGDRFGLVLAKGSPLTAKVTAAVDALRADGTLDALAQKWLAADGNAPVLK